MYKRNISSVNTPTRSWLKGALLLSGALVAGVAARGGPSSLEFDLDGDGTMERVALDTSQRHALGVYRGHRCVARAVLSTWKPWRLMLADVEGDGRTEIVVGVHKATRFIRHAHNCLFVYWFDGRTIQPRWLGSALSRPFTDFTFAPPVKSRAWPLYAIECDRRGRSSLSEYAWSGFGFMLVRRDGAWRRARIVSADRSAVALLADGQYVRHARGSAARTDPKQRSKAR